MFNEAISFKRKNGSKSGDEQCLSPHVYGVADNTFRSMMRALEIGNSEVDVKSDQSLFCSLGKVGREKQLPQK